MAKKKKTKKVVKTKPKKPKEIDYGLIFVGAILILVAIYLFVTQTDFATQWVGGGILAILGLFLFIIPSLKKSCK